MGAALVGRLYGPASSRSLTVSIADARALFAPEGTYLNTASYGLPPLPAWDALQQALDEWRHGRTSWEEWNATTDRARAVFARLVGADPAHVTVGASVFGGTLRAIAAPQDHARERISPIPVSGSRHRPSPPAARG